MAVLYSPDDYVRLMDLMGLYDDEQWQEYGSAHFYEVDVPRRIGFDRVVVGTTVIGIDWQMLDDKLEEEREMPDEFRTLKVQDCRTSERRLRECPEDDSDHWYSKIQVYLDGDINRDQFILSKCNISDDYEICLIKVFVPYIQQHPILGNIRNMTCEEEKAHILRWMDKLADYGIHLDREVANIRSVEINVNIEFSAKYGDFRDAVEIIRPYRHCLKNFRDSDFGEEDKEYLFPETNMNVHISGTTSEGRWVESLEIPKRKKTSFNSLSSTRIIKVYDKSSEIMSKSGGTVCLISPVTRIEYELTDRNNIPTYFNGKQNIFDMTQDDIEDAFHRMTSRYIKKSLDDYYREWKRALGFYFEKIDIQQRGWKKNVVLYLDGLIKKTDGFLIISYDDLLSYVSNIQAKSVSKNRSRIAKQLKDEFKEASCIRISETNLYSELMDWLCTVKGEEEQSVIYLLKREDE